MTMVSMMDQQRPSRKLGSVENVDGSLAGDGGDGASQKQRKWLVGLTVILTGATETRQALWQPGQA